MTDSLWHSTYAYAAQEQSFSHEIVARETHTSHGLTVFLMVKRSQVGGSAQNGPVYFTIIAATARVCSVLDKVRSRVYVWM